MPVSLKDFLVHGRFGPFEPRRHVGPAEVIALFGPPTEVWPPEARDSQGASVFEFPLVVSYEDVEFHFSAVDELHTLFVDTFFGEGGGPDGGPIALADAPLLRGGMPMDVFLGMAKAESIGIRSVRPHAAPLAFIATTSGSIELGFQHDDPDAPGSVPVLRWFCWPGGGTPA